MSGSKTREITSQNFESVVLQPGIVLLDFWAGWCGPCRRFAPIFEAAANNNPDLVWGKIDTEAQTELAGLFEIRSIPTLMIFRDGIRLFAQAGLVTPAGLDDLVNQVRAVDMAEVRRQVEAANKGDSPS